MSYARGAYRRRLKLDSLDDVVSTVWTLLVPTSIVVTLQVLVDADAGTAARETARLGLVAFVLVAAGRVAVNFWQLQTRRQGQTLVPTLIVGAGHIGRHDGQAPARAPELGLRPVGFLDKEPLLEAKREAHGAAGARGQLGSRPDRLRRYEHRAGDRHVLDGAGRVAPPARQPVRGARDRGCRSFPRLFERSTTSVSPSSTSAASPLDDVATSRPERPGEFAVKYALDRLIACMRCLSCCRRCSRPERCRGPVEGRDLLPPGSASASTATRGSRCSSSARWAVAGEGGEGRGLVPAEVGDGARRSSRAFRPSGGPASAGSPRYLAGRDPGWSTS